MIGVFDSGIGGLSVLAALRSAYPSADLLYYADTARLPYGGRSPALIRRFAKEAGERFKGWGADFVQVACGTVSSIALDAFTAAAGCPVSGVVLPVVGSLGLRYLCGRRAQLSHGIVDGDVVCYLRTVFAHRLINIIIR